MSAMMKRACAAILLVGMVGLFTACGIFDDGQKSEGGEGGPLPSNEIAAPSMSIGYGGPRSLEERILASPIIARVRLDSATSTIESVTIFDGTTKHIALLEFRFRALEYLKGSRGGDIVAVWESRPLFDTRQETEAALPTIVAARDTQWDGREAIIFLQYSQTYLPSTQQTDHYYLSWRHEIDT